MIDLFKRIHNSLVSKLIIAVGVILLLIISGWAFFDIRYQREKLLSGLLEGAAQLTDTILLGTHYAMMTNSRDDINQIINNIGRLEEIETIRIYNKQGQIKFSYAPGELERTTNIKAEACDVCHLTDPPLSKLALEGRTRFFETLGGKRVLGILTPIYNEPSCSTDDCHVHPADKTVLGALDVTVSLGETDQRLRHSQKSIIAMAVAAFICTAAFIFFFVLRFVNRPIRRLVDGTRRIAAGDYDGQVVLSQADEMGQMADAINRMGRVIGEKHTALNEQRDEYQSLFESVPCIITVQDRNYRLVRYNREFEQLFAPQPGDFCYRAYKGRDTKCPDCPVEKTFADGKSHMSEETGFSKDGTPAHWIVQTTPLRNARGEVVAAMEMNLDITRRKQLEQRLAQSEKKYHEIFNQIPNPVFVLAVDSLRILDCNESITPVYGYRREEVIDRSFLDFFKPEERARYEKDLQTAKVINQATQVSREGRVLFVNLRLSPSEYTGQQVILVTASDITKRLEAEQQLIQASKMATLGEMATGVAHELNQPLAVIKTASGYFMRKVRRQEPIPEGILSEMSSEIDSHVDRASKIISHMRQFGRKSELRTEPVRIDEALVKSFEFFSQQLKVRGIKVVWETAGRLPEALADADRLEQVFINLLINARDAIEDRWANDPPAGEEKRITLRTAVAAEGVSVEICDNGTGIPAEIVDRVFEPFFTTKHVGKGTGLGLSISYGIVKDYGGTIRARRGDGGGACFTVTFPPSEAGDG